MKVLITLVALAAAACATPATPASPTTVPAPPPGWQPSGRLLLLPARLENNTPETEKESQPEGGQAARFLDSGEYYVLLPDGRLQMVKYTTAALAEEAQQQQQKQQYRAPAESQQQQQQYRASQPQQFLFPFPPESSTLQKSQQVKQAEAPVYQVQYVQFPLAGSRYSQTKLELQEQRSEQQQQAEEVKGFEANVQYRDVKPVSGPIYAYNPTPLVRVLRHI